MPGPGERRGEQARSGGAGGASPRAPSDHGTEGALGSVFSSGPCQPILAFDSGLDWMGVDICKPSHGPRSGRLGA